MNAEGPAEEQAKTSETPPAPAGEGQPQRRPEGGRGGRFRRGGRGRGRGGRDGRDNRGPREPRPEGERREEQGTRAPHEGGKPPASVRQAIEQVLHIRAELRRVLDELQEVLRTLDHIEGDQTASEDEIEMLREALRALHREPPPFNRSRGGSPYRPAPQAAPHPADPEPEDEDDAEPRMASEPEPAGEERAEPPDNGEDADPQQS